MSRQTTDRRYDVLLWDLDGTIVDSFPGIVASLSFTLSALGYPIPNDFRECLGPPLRTNLARLMPGASNADIERGVDVYKEHYLRDMSGSALYPRMEALVKAASEEGFSHFICTNKATLSAESVLRHLSLLDHFRAVYGTPFEGTPPTKVELIRQCIHEHSLEHTRCVMIGDRHHDIESAQTVGIDSIGVLWGYGSREELEASQPTHLVESPGELASLFRLCTF